MLRRADSVVPKDHFFAAIPSRMLQRAGIVPTDAFPAEQRRACRWLCAKLSPAGSPVGRSARVAESDSLLMSCLGKPGPRVQIPASPRVEVPGRLGRPELVREPVGASVHCSSHIRVRSSTDRASDYGSEGWGFESLRTRQAFPQLIGDSVDRWPRLGRRSSQHSSQHRCRSARTLSRWDSTGRDRYGSADLVFGSFESQSAPIR